MIASLVCRLALLGAGAAEGFRFAFLADKPSVATTVAIADFTPGPYGVPHSTPPGLPGYAGTALWLLLAELGLLVVLLVVVWRAARAAARPADFGERGPSAAWRVTAPGCCR